MQRGFAAAETLFQAGSLSRSSCLSKVNSIFKAAETIFVDLVARNRLKLSFWRLNSSRWFSMYSIAATEWYQYCAIRWKYTKFLTDYRAPVKGILELADGFKRVARKTGTITCMSAYICLPLHCGTWLYGLLNWVLPGYGGFITQSWFNLSIMECCSRKDVTQCNKFLTKPW